MLKKSVFNIEFDPFYDGYTNEDHWNGWACPWFTFSVAEQMMTALNASVGEQHLTYDKESDTFVHTIDEENVYEFKGEDIQTEDGVLHLYPIGTACWIWDDAEEWYGKWDNIHKHYNFGREEMRNFIKAYLAQNLGIAFDEAEEIADDIVYREFAVTGTPKFTDIPKYVNEYMVNR